MKSLRVASSRGQSRRREEYVERSASMHGVDPSLLYTSDRAVICKVCVPSREDWG